MNTKSAVEGDLGGGGAANLYAEGTYTSLVLSLRIVRALLALSGAMLVPSGAILATSLALYVVVPVLPRGPVWRY